MPKGFSISAEQDRLYALGWPHLRRLVDKHKLDKKPEETAKAVLDDPEPPSQFGVEWPREAASRVVRAFVESPKSSGWDAAISKPGPIDAAGARLLVDRALSPATIRPQLQTADFLLLLEAIVGTETVTDAVLSKFERYQPKDWLADTLRHAFFTAMVTPAALTVAYHLGFLLQRLPDSLRKKFRARAEAVLKAAPPGRPLHVAFDLALHGGEAVRRNRVKALCACHHVVDDPSLVRQLAQHDEHALSLSPRFVYLGGIELLDHFSERAKSLPRWSVYRFAEEFSTIRHPKMVPIMLTLSQKKLAKDLPFKWFLDTAETTKPLVAELAIRKSPQGEAARAILDQLKAYKPPPPPKPVVAGKPAAAKPAKGAAKAAAKPGKPAKAPAKKPASKPVSKPAAKKPAAKKTPVRKAKQQAAAKVKRRK
ncbi:MAG: hypothetical protein NVS3B10_07490 [Polyangiales bacterium]